MSVVDITGQRFGRLVAIELAPRPWPSGNARWLCQCDCGQMHVASGSNMRTGRVRSCGCSIREWAKTGNNRRRHGASDTSTYGSWSGMRNRCLNPSEPRYPDYGGRGITVCARWDDFANFLADMGERPDGLTLDRIDNDGNYEPGNCKWSTPLEQSQNRRPRRWQKRPPVYSEARP
jgi:hypothetical protein